ncbi:hypothetical protein GE061_009524 [Apolygus lucorum]|uniref:Uncharacterized protein n=1 Tax=Apolygus lucorum TaxID=248454 RepID=A0A8S9Y2I6_APOLU|nr:hypothetical protein GE061_009524 [Apolygus lucorum]
MFSVAVIDVCLPFIKQLTRQVAKAIRAYNMADIKDKMSETVNASNISVGVPLRSSDKDASCDVAEGCQKDIFINFTLGNESSTSLDNEVPHDTTMNLSRIDESKKFGKRPQSRRVSVKFDCDGSVSDDSKISLTQDPLLDKTQSPRAGKVASLRSNSGVKRKKRNESDRVNFTLSDTQDSIPSLEASISDLEAISETSEVLNTYISSDLRKEAETNAESDIAPEITAHAPICAQRDDVEGADCNNGESHDHAVEGVDSNSDRRPGSHAKDTMGGSCPPVQETANNDSLVSGLPQDTTVNLSRTGEFKNCFKRPKSRRVSVKFDCDDSLSDDSKVSLPQEELLDKTQSLRAGNAVSLKPIHSDREEISKLAGTSKVTSLGSPVSSESRQEEETNAESDIAPEITVNSPICAQRDDVESADCNNGESHDNAVEGVDLITDRSDTGLMVRGCAERGSEYPPPNPIPVKGEHRTMQNTPGPLSIETVKGSCPPVPETSDNGSSLTLDYEVPHDTTVNLSRIGEANKCFKRLQSRRVSVKFDCDDLLSDDSKVSLTQDEFLDKSQSPRAGNAVSLKPIHSDSEEISKLAETSKVTSPETSDNGSSLTLDYEVPHETNAELDIAPDITADAADGSELEENPVIQHVPHALLSETMTIRSPLTSNNNDQVISTDEASLPRQVTEGDSSEVGSRIYQSGATRSSPRINVYTEDVPKIADEVHNRLDDATYILAVDQSVDESVLIEKQKPNLIVKRQSVRQKNKNIDFTLNETLHSVSTEDSTLKSRNYENPLKKRSSRRNKVSVSLSMDSSTSHDASNSRLLVEDGVAPSPSPSVEAGAPYRNEITPTVEAYPQNGTMPGTCLHSTMMQNVPDTSLSDTLTVKSPPANNSYDLAISIDEASLPRQVTEDEPSFGGVESPKVGTEIDQSGATRPRINVFTDDGSKVANEVHIRSDGAKYISAMDQSGLSVVTESSILPQLKNTQVSANESVLIEKQKPNLIVKRQSVRQKNKNIDFTFSETPHSVTTEDSTLKPRNFENPLKKRSSRRNKVSVPLSMDSSTLHDASNSRLLVEDGVAPSPNPFVEAGAPYMNEITPTVEAYPQNGTMPGTCLHSTMMQNVPDTSLSDTLTVKSPPANNSYDLAISIDEASLPRQVTEDEPSFGGVESPKVGTEIDQSGATRPRINVFTDDGPKVANEVHNRSDGAKYISAMDQSGLSVVTESSILPQLKNTQVSANESVLIEKQKPNLIVKRQSVRQKNKNIDFTFSETPHSVTTEDSTLKPRNYENPLKKRSSRRNKVSVPLSMDSSTLNDASNSRLLVEDGVAPSPNPSVEAGAPYMNEITPTVEAYPQNGTMPGTCLHSTMMQNVPDTSLSDTLTVKSPPANNSYDLAISIDEASLPRQVTEGEPSFGGVESPKVGTEIDQSGATRPRINVFTDDGPKVADEVHSRSDGAKYISAMDQSGLSVVTASSILPQLKNTQVSADESVLIEKQKPNLIVRRQSVRQKNKNIDFTFSETLHSVSTEDSTLKSKNYENPSTKRSSRRNKVSVPLSMHSSTLHDASNSRLLVEDGVAPLSNPSVEVGAPNRNEITPTVEEHPQNGSCLPIDNLPNDDKMLTKDGISVVETEDFDHSGVTASNNHMQQNNTQEMPLNDNSLMDSQEFSETPFAESIATKKSTLESEYHNHLKSREFEKNEVSVCRSTQPSSLDNEKACATLMVVSSVARSSELTFPGTAVAEGDMHEIPTIHNSPGSLVDIQRSGLPKSESFDQDAKRKPINALMDVTKNCASDIHSRRSSAHSVVREGGKPSFEKNSTNDEHLHLAVSDGDLIQKSTSLNSIDSANDPIFCKKSVISADSVGCADSLAQTKCALPSKPSQPSCVHDVAEVDKKNTSCVVSSAADDVNSSCPINHEALPPPSSSLLVQPSSSKATHNDPATNDCSPPAVEVTMKSRPSSDDDPKAQAIGEKNLVDIPLPSSIVKDTVNRTAIKKLSKSKRKSVSFKPPHQNVYHSPNYHYNELNQNSSGREGGEKDYNEFSKIQMTSDLSEIQTSVRATRSKKHCSSTPLPKPKQRRVASASFKSVQDRDDVRREGNTNNGDLFAKPVPVSALVTEFLVPPPPLFAKNPDSKLSPGRISPVTPVDPAGLSPRDGKEKHATGRNSSSSDKTSIDLSIENSLNISVIPKDRVAPKWGNVFHSTPIHRPRPSKTRSRKSSPEVPNVAEDHPVNKSRKLRSRSRQESQISMDVASPISSQNKEDSKVSESVDSARGRDGSVDHLPESNQSSSDDSSPHRVSIKDNTVLSSRNVSHSRARDFASSKSSRSSHLTRGSSYQSYDSHRKPVSRRLIVDVDSADEEKENDNGNQETSIRGDVASPAQSESLGGNDGCADTSVSSLPPSYSGASPASSVSSYDSNIAPYISQRSSLKSQLDSLKKTSSSSSCQGSEATFPRHQTRNVDEPKKPRSKFSINRRSKTKPEDGVIFPKAPKRPRRAIQKPPEGSNDLNEWSRQPRKLFKPGKWASKKFYNWLEQKLKPEHGLKATVMAEKFVIDIYHAHIMASNHHLEEARATLRERTKELGICSTELEYSYFILKFLPLDFKKQFLPLGGAFGSALAPRALPYDAL